MALTVLQIIQAASTRIGILKPAAAVSAADLQTLQMVALSEEEGQEQADRYTWEVLQIETIFTTVAVQSQGVIQTLAPGFNYIVNDTIWNRTLRRPIYGPKSEQDWQQSVAMQINGPFNAFRIQNDNLNFYPLPVAGQTCSFEYMSKNWIQTSIGGTSAFWTNDADMPLIDDQLMILGTIWRWKQAKGLDYSEDFAKYEKRILDAMGRNAGKPVLSTGGQNQYEIQPVIAVPRGSFTQ